MSHVTVCRAAVSDADHIARMVGELLLELMQETKMASFDVDEVRTKTQASSFIEQEQYAIFIAVSQEQKEPVGFLSVSECRALYAGGHIGIIPECYVRPAFRSQGIGSLLIEAVKNFGRGNDWTRLEVTTPPLPGFQRTLEFYEKLGFEVTGGRKLKVLL